MENTSAIILSSGFSERMGKPKAFLKWNESTTFIEKIINEFNNFGCEKIVCIINNIIEPSCSLLNVPESVKFIVNPHPEKGRFGSIKIGVSEIVNSEFCFIHNVDNPFINIDTLGKVYSVKSHNAWCSPVYKGKGGHPVLLPQTILKKIEEINNPDTILSNVLNNYYVNKVEVNNDSILRNINTPEEYSAYFHSEENSKF